MFANQEHTKKIIITPMPQNRHKLIPAVHLFLIQNKKILLSRRFKTGWEDGKYSVPAGHLDGNETLTQAIIRETKEEIGIKLKAKHIAMVHTMNRKSDDSERLDFFYIAKKWDGVPEIKERNKCDDIRWFPLNALPHNIIPYVRQAIKNIQNTINYSEFGWKTKKMR